MKRLAPVLLAAAVLFFGPAALVAQDHSGHEHHQPAAPPAKDSGKQEPAAVRVLNLPVLTQDGTKVLFYDDLVKGKVVAINFIFTTCTTICPPLAATFSKMQELLGDQMGRDVYLISVSVDPAVDTPARLKAWAAKFHRQPGWTLVTGDKQVIGNLLSALGVPVGGRPEDHPALLLIGNDRRGHWTRAYGLAPVANLTKLLQDAAGIPPSSTKEGSR